MPGHRQTPVGITPVAMGSARDPYVANHNRISCLPFHKFRRSGRRSCGELRPGTSPSAQTLTAAWEMVEFLSRTTLVAAIGDITAANRLRLVTFSGNRLLRS
jgi:hypothetical protein